MYYVYTHMKQYGIFLSVKNASALLPLRLAQWRLCCVCACVFVCRVDLPLCQYVRTHVYTGFEYLQQQQQQLVVAFLRFFCASSMCLVISYVRRLAILTAFADLFRL